MTKLYVGKIFNLNAGGSCTVISFKDKGSIVVEHNDEYRFSSKVEFAQLKRGTVKNPYTKSVCGVGYIGVGTHKPYNKGVASKSYLVWRGVLKRCYSNKEYSANSSYLGCSVSTSWMNFQNFAEWYENHDYYGLGYELDKDILVRGNKVYSSETCCLVPSIINMAVVSPSGGGVTGVTVREGRKNAFEAYTKEGGVNRYLGAYPTLEEAFIVYKDRKESYLKSLAEEWRGNVSEEVYHALISWDITLP